jgi:hypothetical protein
LSRPNSLRPGGSQADWEDPSSAGRPNSLRSPGIGGGGGEWEEPPRFDLRLPENITVAEGQTALLRCRVHYLGNRTVGGS